MTGGGYGNISMAVRWGDCWRQQRWRGLRVQNTIKVPWDWHLLVGGCCSAVVHIVPPLPALQQLQAFLPLTTERPANQWSRSDWRFIVVFLHSGEGQLVSRKTIDDKGRHTAHKGWDGLQMCEKAIVKLLQQAQYSFTTVHWNIHTMTVSESFNCSTVQKING